MTNPDGNNTGWEGGIDAYNGAGLGTALFSGLADTYISSRTAKRNTDKTIQAQKEEAEKAYQRSIQSWNMQNAYNSPEEQMKRYGAAGLNKHLIYGQGTPGNAQGATPQYQPANIRYQYEAPAYGAASQNAVQALMQVGTWMQNMKLSEQEVQKNQTGNETATEMLGYLRNANPKKLQELDNRLSTYPYQAATMRNLAERGNLNLTDMLEELRYKWGREFEGLEFGEYQYQPTRYDGTKSQAALKQIAERKLLEAKASWTDYNITDPQSLMEMVLKGVIGMTGQTLRINQRARNVQPTFKQKWTPPTINNRRRGFQR